MKKFLLVTGCCILITGAYGQTVSQKLQKAFQLFENDSQLKHAISSLCVIDAKTGQVVFDKNAQVGLAPASTQKIITSVTAFELLGKDYRYKTEFGYQGTITNRKLKGRIYVLGSGDPTLGSWRYESTKEMEFTKRIVKAIQGLKIDTADYVMFVEDRKFETSNIPDGWIWQDIGNYYGAGAGALNWRENQYEVILKSGNTIGDNVEIAAIRPYNYFTHEIESKVSAAAKGSGDNAYIYMPLGNLPAFIKGTIPINEKRFIISGAIPNPAYEFQNRMMDTIKKAGIFIKYDSFPMFNIADDYPAVYSYKGTVFYTAYSPTLDSIIYWFNKKSINLYGEALIKTFAYEKQGFGSTDSGVAIVKKFWKEKGLDPDELNMYDGSGLSPMNRVTTHAQVEILKYAKTKDWYPSFYNALPEYNGMRMKSGTIGDVKGFCGYHKAKDGKEYIFSFLVNNYSGKTSGVVSKMYKVLDELK
ncbi:MAG: D-alanyl-D-alanine carboxypeptidase/D-alanyl-D-alanine-endopeptidase [Bacteroidota bacterium]|nr:D-alanyl-D-alanine carboxypeptidase/D-alanyl-D-alanine-endopeptidase [Bacteroidota bacterium]